MKSKFFMLKYCPYIPWPVKANLIDFFRGFGLYGEFTPLSTAAPAATPEVSRNLLRFMERFLFG